VSEKTLKILVGALLVAVILWGGVTLVSRWTGGGPTAAPALANIFQGARADSVTAVRITGPKDSVNLERKGTRWTVNDFATDSGMVSDFFTTLRNTKVGDLVSTNPANQAAMGISKDSAWTLTFDLGGKARTLLVGKTGPRYATAYVRLPGQDRVYLADGNLRSEVTRPVDDWRNKRIVAVDTAAVHRLEVERDGESYTLVRSDSTWTLAGGEAVDKTAVHDILDELSGLQAAGYFEKGDTLANSPEGARVLALSASGDTLGQVTLGSGKADRWARTPGDSVTYRLAGWRVDRLVPERKTVVSVAKKAAAVPTAKGKPVASTAKKKASTAKKKVGLTPRT
jgi:hypothetical protein